MRASALDGIDLKILATLQEDASRSAADVAAAIGLSQPPCWRRIQRLKDRGYISRVVALLDRSKLALHAHFFVQVKLTSHDQASLAEFSRVIREFPEVLECHLIGGVFDFLLRVVTTDIDAYERFHVQSLLRAPHVREVTSFVAASEIKFTTSLPLQQ